MDLAFFPVISFYVGKQLCHEATDTRAMHPELAKNTKAYMYYMY